MPKVQGSNFYAVARGRKPGVYTTWEECKAQVDGFAGAKYKKFHSAEQAEEWKAEHEVGGGVGHTVVATTPTKPSVHTKPSTSTMSRPYPDPHAFSTSTSTTTAAAAASTAGPSKPQVGPKPSTLAAVQAALAESSIGSKTNTTIATDLHGKDVVYSDGACKGNGRPGSVAGVGVWWGPDDPRNIAERCPGAQTNNRAELIAIIRVLETTPKSKRPLIIKTDSQYSIKCFRQWLPKWRKNGFRSATGAPVANQPLIKYLDSLLSERGQSGQKVELQYVKGHSGDVGNDGADSQANRGCTFDRVDREPEWESLEDQVRKRMEDGLDFAVDVAVADAMDTSTAIETATAVAGVSGGKALQGSQGIRDQGIAEARIGKGKSVRVVEPATTTTIMREEEEEEEEEDSSMDIVEMTDLPVATATTSSTKSKFRPATVTTMPITTVVTPPSTPPPPPQPSTSLSRQQLIELAIERSLRSPSPTSLPSPPHAFPLPTTPPPQPVHTTIVPTTPAPVPIPIPPLAPAAPIIVGGGGATGYTPTRVPRPHTHHPLNILGNTGMTSPSRSTTTTTTTGTTKMLTADGGVVATAGARAAYTSPRVVNPRGGSLRKRLGAELPARQQQQQHQEEVIDVDAADDDEDVGGEVGKGETKKRMGRDEEREDTEPGEEEEEEEESVGTLELPTSFYVPLRVKAPSKSGDVVAAQALTGVGAISGANEESDQELALPLPRSTTTTTTRTYKDVGVEAKLCDCCRDGVHRERERTMATRRSGRSVTTTRRSVALTTGAEEGVEVAGTTTTTAVVGRDRSASPVPRRGVVVGKERLTARNGGKGKERERWPLSQQQQQQQQEGAIGRGRKSFSQASGKSLERTQPVSITESDLNAYADGLLPEDELEGELSF